MSNEHRRAGLAFLFVIVLTLQPLIPVWSAPSAADPPVDALVRTFQSTSAGPAQRNAALAIFHDYDAYKSLVASGKVSPSTARAVDEVLVTMTQEAWRDVAVRQKAGLEYVVPVGTLGDRWGNKNYIPGKSDKDFIPRGPRAGQAAADFNLVFEQKFGIKPGVVDVNALDPTNISSWPDRVAAATNFEKYNTRGGTIWLENELHKNKPNLWTYDGAMDGIVERRFSQIVTTAPPPLTSAEAMGFFSDNTKFRAHLAADYAGNPAVAAFKQAKYDLRNITAFELAGGSLSDSDKQLQGVMDLLREGKRADALARIKSLTGLTDPNAAMRAYLEATDALTQRMGQHVLDKHLGLVADALASGKPSHALANELAASLANLPPGQADAAKDAILAKLGRTEGGDVVRMAEAFRRRVSFSLDFFDNMAVASFGKKYDQLSDAQRAILHGADDTAEGFRLGVGSALGIALSGWAVYNAYVEGSQHGTAVGIASGTARAMVELLQAGVPALALAELAVHVVAGGVQLGAAAYKNDVLDALYARYKADGNLDFLLNIQGVVPYYAGGLRQLAIDIRMANPNASEEEIRKKIEDYFIRRLKHEEQAKETAELMQRLVAWDNQRDVGFFSTQFVDEFTDEDNLNMANLLAAYTQLRDQLAADGINADERTLLGLLWQLFHRAGSQAGFEARLADLYKLHGKQYPPGGPRACKNRPVIKQSQATTLTRKEPPGQPGQLFSAGGSFTGKVDTACDPVPVVAPIELAAGGHIRVNITGQAAPCVWSLWNSGGAVSVSHAPKWGTSYGPAQHILTASLSCEDPNSEADTNVTVEGDVPGPGRLIIAFGAPAGSGPLTAGCLESSYHATGELVSVTSAAPSPDGSALADGDRVQVGDNGSAFLIIPGVGSVLIRGGSQASYTAPPSDEEANACATSPQTLTLENGRMHVQGQDDAGKLIIRAGDRTLRPRGTVFEVEHSESGGRLVVVDGAVEVESPQGETIVVEAGRQYVWPDGSLTDADLAALPPATLGDLPIDQWPLDDYAPAPYGETVAAFDEGLPPDWLWQDPGQDATVVFPVADTLDITVPDGNDLWADRSTAPRLLHKVTGDFDLEAEVVAGPDGANLVTAEFLLYAPASYIGVLANQMTLDRLSQHFRLLSGRGLGAYGDRLGLRNCSGDRCPAGPPGEPVHLKLTRRGDLWRSYWSPDGATWTLAQIEEIILPDTLWAGWLMKRIAYDGRPDVPGRVTLRNIRLTTAPRQMLPPPDWDLLALPHQAAIGQDGRVQLTIDGSAGAWLAAIQGDPFVGDFDVVVRAEPHPEEPLAGASRSHGLLAATLDEKLQAYVAFGDIPSWIGRGYLASQLTETGWSSLVRHSTSLDPAAAWLRLTRRNGQLDSYAWADCRWLPIAHYPALLDDPLFVYVYADNRWDAGVFAPLTVDFTPVQMAAGPAILAQPWTSPGCNLLTPAADLPVPQLAEGHSPQSEVMLLQAAYPLGKAFAGPDGEVYIFSSHREKRLLLRMDTDGMTRIAVEGDALAGVNNKAGVALPDGNFAIAVDGWAEGGNSLAGIVTLAPDGTHTPWPLSHGQGGLTDLIATPDGYWFSDFENDNLWFVPAEGGEEQPAIAPDPRLIGVTDLAYDAASGILYALNQAGDWPRGGDPAIMRIADDAVVPVAVPEGGDNFGGIAVSPGGVLPPGLYASEPAAGRIVRVEADGTLTPVVTGLPQPYDLVFDAPGASALPGLTIVCADGLVARIEQRAQPSHAPSPPPSQTP